MIELIQLPGNKTACMRHLHRELLWALNMISRVFLARFAIEDSMLCHDQPTAHLSHTLCRSARSNVQRNLKSNACWCTYVSAVTVDVETHKKIMTSFKASKQRRKAKEGATSQNRPFTHEEETSRTLVEMKVRCFVPIKLPPLLSYTAPANAWWRTEHHITVHALAPPVSVSTFKNIVIRALRSCFLAKSGRILTASLHEKQHTSLMKIRIVRSLTRHSVLPCTHDCLSEHIQPKQRASLVNSLAKRMHRLRQSCRLWTLLAQFRTLDITCWTYSWICRL